MSVPTALQFLQADDQNSYSNPFTTMRRTILVFGATGKQGSATVSQLCELPNSKSSLQILAVTRNPHSNAAIDLKEKTPQIELVQGDYDNLGALFDSLPSTPYALFSVQPSLYRGYTPEKEVQQGRSLHEAAIDSGISHIVYTSVDRHGTESERVCGVPHFDSKLEIETHLIAECARSKKTTWTILRPTSFFDNYTPDMAGRVVAATFGLAKHGQQFVACKDIGWFAARALTDTEGKYTERKISLAGEKIRLESMRERFYEKMGYVMPEGYSWMGSGALWAMKDLGIMYKWLNEVGYDADLEECRKEHPGMLNFSKWIEFESGFGKGGAVMNSWMQ